MFKGTGFPVIITGWTIHLNVASDNELFLVTIELSPIEFTVPDVFLTDSIKSNPVTLKWGSTVIPRSFRLPKGSIIWNNL